MARGRRGRGRGTHESQVRNAVNQRQETMVPCEELCEEANHSEEAELPATERTPTRMEQSQESLNPMEQRRSSYAAMADPNEGSPLRFIPVSSIGGVKCAKIDQCDVESEVEYWANAVLCSVVGAYPPLAVIEGFIRRIWQKFDIDKVVAVRKGVFLVRFQEEQGKREVLNRGVYFFDRKPMVVKPWNEDMSINIEEIQSLPLWVRLPHLDIKYWGCESLSKIGSMIGIPIKTDKTTMTKDSLSYARLLIDVSLKGPFPETVDFINDKGDLVRQEVEFEWKPTCCTYCKMFGHTDEECRKKKGGEKGMETKG